MPELVQPLPRQEVVNAIERRNPRRIPMVMTHWWGEGLWDEYGDRLHEFDRFPNDAPLLLLPALDLAAMDIPWRPPADEVRAHDSGGLLPDWGLFDDFLTRVPDPDRPGAMDAMTLQADAVRESGRYFLWGFWNLFFEMPWNLRGMENILTDYYEHPAEVHRLHDALCSLYERWIRRAARELRPDGFWTSDDLGHQTQPMMRPKLFREFLKPYYRRIAETCHDCGLHFWLHSCGNNTPLLPDLIDAGLDVFHPVQKHTMREREVAEAFGDRLTFLAGFDVQHTLPEGTPDEVRAEVRALMDTFDRPDGGMLIAAGNGIVSGTPFENIEAFLDEASRYGEERRRPFQP